MGRNQILLFDETESFRWVFGKFRGLGALNVEVKDFWYDNYGQSGQD